MRGENRESLGPTYFVSWSVTSFFIVILYCLLYLAEKLNIEPLFLFEHAAQPGMNAVTPSMGAGSREVGSTEGLAKAKANFM